LRWLLSRYVGPAPRALGLAENPAGKPVLIEPGGGLQFNVSHTDDLWVCAVAAGQPVGVDVERIRPLSARHVTPFLAPEERAAWTASFDPASGAEGVTALLALWTRKEAYIKARGLGLHLPLDAFAVSVDLDRPPRLQYDRRDPQAPTRWCLTDLNAFPGVRGALAIAKPLRSVRLRAVRVGSRARSDDEWVGMDIQMALS
jgi:4'-phosphopantetheinyl transferase